MASCASTALRFTVFNSANSEELPSNRIIELKEGRDGSLWLATEQGHIVRFRAGRFTTSRSKSGKRESKVHPLRRLGRHRLGRERPRDCGSSGAIALVRVGRGTLDARVTAIVQRRDGSLWVGTERAGIFRVGGDSRVTKVVTDPALDADFIGRMIEDASGALWIAGTRALWSWRERLVRVKGAPPAPNFSRLVAASARDRRRVWRRPRPAYYRIESDSSGHGAPGVQPPAHRLWADAGAIWNVDGPGCAPRRSTRLHAAGAAASYQAALFDREGSLWLGTDAGGLHRLKPALFTTYSVPEGVGAPERLLDVRRPLGRVWLGTWGERRESPRPRHESRDGP